MRLYITRDSVCAADDFHAPHAREGSIADDANAAEIVDVCVREYLPNNIIGGCATWALSSGVPIAVIAQQWSSPKLVSKSPLVLEHFDIIDNTLKLHFTYLGQDDPDVVYAILSKLKLHTD